MKLLERLMTKDQTCIVTDTRYTPRWDGKDPTRCKGDLAFYCNNQKIAEELKRWAETREEEDCPRCTDDVIEPQFAEMLYNFAEELHLRKSRRPEEVETEASVGTEEAQTEEEINPIDEVYGPEDEVVRE